MKDYLSFLSEFEVKKRLNADTFLQKASISQKSSEYLLQHIDDIKLLYDIRFSDQSEFIVFHVNLTNWDSKYAEIDTAKHIASSVPYECMVALQNRKAVKFYIFDRHLNSRNERRSVIERTYFSPTVMLDRYSSTDTAIRDAIEFAYQVSHSSTEFRDFLYVKFEEVREQKLEAHIQKLMALGYISDYDEYGIPIIVHPEEWKVMAEIQKEETI